jgi:hypothetical protein
VTRPHSTRHFVAGADDLDREESEIENEEAPISKAGLISGLDGNNPKINNGQERQTQRPRA